MAVTSKIRLYDLAKELKLDTKRLIEEVRREGVDVSVPSNSVSKELAEKIRNKYFPKKETAAKRVVRVVKKAERAVEETPPVEAAEPVAEVGEPAAEAEHEEVVAAQPAVEAPKQPAAARVIKKLTPAMRAEQPAAPAEAAAPVEITVEPETEELAQETEAATDGLAAPATSGSGTVTAPPSRQVRVLRPTVAALNAGIRPGERAPAPSPRRRPQFPATAPIGPLAFANEHHFRAPNGWERPAKPPLPKRLTFRLPTAGRRRSRRAPTRGGRKIEGKAGRFDKGDFIPPPKALSLEDRIAGRMEIPPRRAKSNLCV